MSRFYAALNRVMRELDYKVVACALKKDAHVAAYGLADLVVSPIGRFVAGLSPREDFEIVREKLRRRDGEYRGAGLVILPKG